MPDDATKILSQIEAGDASATDQFLPLVYSELGTLAAVKLDREKPGQTLVEATALVHEAYVRLVDVEKVQHWDSRGHFFAAAAEAMRRILIDSARKKASKKRGGDRVRQILDEQQGRRNIWYLNFKFQIKSTVGLPPPGRYNPRIDSIGKSCPVR